MGVNKNSDLLITFDTHFQNCTYINLYSSTIPPFVILLIPFYKLSNSLFQGYNRLIVNIFLKIFCICPGSGNIARLHRHVVLFGFNSEMFLVSVLKLKYLGSLHKVKASIINLNDTLLLQDILKYDLHEKNSSLLLIYHLVKSSRGIHYHHQKIIAISL